jgi:hypothetical protein
VAAVKKGKVGKAKDEFSSCNEYVLIFTKIRRLFINIMMYYAFLHVISEHEFGQVR